MVVEWIPELELEGFQGIVHGGIVSTVLDEAMSKL
jgi:acyl-coenzyme A thioesterase PaaI-like protein